MNTMKTDIDPLLYLKKWLKKIKLFLMDLASKVVDKMLSGDAFSKWLGIEILEISSGYCKLKMKVRKEMTNGFNIAHGGITYSLADSALAFAANSYGTQSLSIETSINHAKSDEWRHINC